MHLSWPWIYGSQALMAAGIGALIGRNVSGAGRWIAFVIAAWLAEPVGVSLLIGFGLILVSLVLVLGIGSSVGVPRLRRAFGASSVS